MRPSLKKRGFTLIESMVAITILTLAVVGPMFAAHRAIIATQISRGQMVASYLAQEGIEYVRSIRDGVYLTASSGADASTVAWTNFLTSSVSSCRASQSNPNVWCTFDPTLPSGALEPCSGGSCAPLRLSSSGVYTQNSGTVTPYTRSIQVLDIPGTTDGASPYPDKRLVSKVSWAYQGQTYTVTVTDHLTPWQ